MKCPNCGAENKPGLRFCEQCATPLAAEKPKPAQACSRCGAQNASGLRFCEQCAAPLIEEKPKAVQTCPKCGAQNASSLRFCEQCAAPLAEPRPRPAPAPPALARRRRWIPWAMAAASALVVLIAVAVALPYLTRPKSAEEEAINVAELIVEEAFPEYAEAQRTVSTWEAEGDKSIYVVNYSIAADEANGIPFPRGINIYFDPETRQVSIEEKN